MGNDPVFKTTLSRRKPNPSSLLVAPFLQLLFLSSHSHEGACSHADVWFNVGCFPSLRSLGGLCPKFNLVLAYSFQLGCINHQLKSSYSSIFEVKTNCWWICSSSTLQSPWALYQWQSTKRSLSEAYKVPDREKLHENQNKMEQPALICKRAPLAKKW